MDSKETPPAPGYANSLLSFKPKHNAVLPAPPNSNFVVLRMRCEVFGYGWYANSSTDYLATAVVVLYMIVAITYTGRVLITGVTSSSWDTVTELLALALQSPIPEALSGSGAGVEKLGTYKRLVRLRARTEEGGAQDRTKERLVLIIDSEGISERKKKELDGIRNRPVVVDEKYL